MNPNATRLAAHGVHQPNPEPDLHAKWTRALAAAGPQPPEDFDVAASAVVACATVGHGLASALHTLVELVRRHEQDLARRGAARGAVDQLHRASAALVQLQQRAQAAPAEHGSRGAAVQAVINVRAALAAVVATTAGPAPAADVVED